MHTSNSNSSVTDAMAGLRPWGVVVLMGIGTDSFEIPALALTSNSYRVIGSAHNGLEYLSEALDIVASGKVRSMIESFPKEQIAEAYEKFSSGSVRFKAVVTY
jgi:alcohol dehydrogenase/propanol-preferring alcohol dehydrogenase